MGISVMKDDVISLRVWGISAVTIRGNVEIRPSSWWSKLAQSVKGVFPQADPYLVFVDVISTTDRSQALGTAVVDADGEIDSANIQLIAGSVPIGPGEVYASLQISRRGVGTGTAFLNIAGGYIYGGRSPTFPGPFLGPLEGPGRLREILTNDPAANAELPATICPTQARWRPQTYSVQLVQGITQTPLPALRFRNVAGLIEAEVPITPTAIGASSTAQLTWARGLVQTSFTTIVGDEFHTAPMPQLDLVAGDDFETITDGIGANTNYGAASVKVEEWINP